MDVRDAEASTPLSLRNHTSHIRLSDMLANKQFTALLVWDCDDPFT